MEKKKKLWQVLIPVLVALAVIAAFAISGTITRRADEKKPTAPTKVSVVNQTEDHTEETQGKTRVRLVAVGDNLIHNTLIAAGEQKDGSRNYDAFYQDIKQYIEPADIAVINQETVLGGSSFDYSGYPCFNSPWEIGDAAIAAGFDGQCRGGERAGILRQA